MKSIFGRQVFQADFVPRRLSQATAFNVFTDIFEKAGISEDTINDLIGKLPETSAKEYRARLEECKNIGLTSGEGVACLYRLFRDLKSGEVSQKVPGPVVPKTPTASSFPTVPVVIGAVVLAGVGIYFAVKK